MTLTLLLVALAAVDGGAAPDAGVAAAEPVLQQLARMAHGAEPTVKSPWVKAWLQAVTTLRSLPVRTFSCEARRCVAGADGGATYTQRVVDDEYVYARVADPLGYARPYDVVADAGFTPKGRRVLDFGYGNAGQLLMLASLGADVTGVEVDPLLPLALAPLSGAVPGGGKLRVLDGFFPADAALTAAVGRGYDLFIAKNTLKRGYVHPEQPVPARQRIDLGVSDAGFIKAVATLLKPGGLFFIYNLSPAQAAAGQPYKPMADGRCPFSKADLEAGGFEVLALDEVDDTAARRMGVALGWDQDPESPWDLEHDLFAHFTLAKKR